MSETTNLIVNVDLETKEQAEKIINDLGISMSNAVDLFLRQVIINKGIPFEIKLEAKHPPCIDDLTEEELAALLQEAMDSIREGKYYTQEQVKTIFKLKYGIDF